MALAWDGSYIGCISKSSFELVAETPTLRYYRITIGNLVLVAAAKFIQNSLPAIVDEIKPLFGLKKVGTHQIEVDSRRYLIFQTRFNGNTIIEDPPLSFIKIDDPDLIESIQRVFAFREVAGLKFGNEKHIRIRPIDNKLVPISFIDPKIAGNQNVSSLTVLRKWFKDRTIEETLGQMFEISTSSPTYTIFFLRSSIERVIFRIDPKAMWYSGYISDRILARLSLINSRVKVKTF